MTVVLGLSIVFERVEKKKKEDQVVSIEDPMLELFFKLWMRSFVAPLGKAPSVQGLSSRF